MLQVVDGEAIRTDGTRVTAVPNGLTYSVSGEGTRLPVKRTPSIEAPLDLPGERIGGVRCFVVNCLLRAVAIAIFVEREVLLKVMGWFGAIVGLLPERDLRRDQNCLVLCLCEHVSTVCNHF